MAFMNGSSRRPSGPIQQQRRPSENPTLASNPHNPNSAAYLAYPVKHVVSSLYRRMTEPPDQPVARLLDAPPTKPNSAVYTPPNRTSSPFQPPPLTPLKLTHPHSPETPLLLTRSLAEEIRLLIPPRIQLVEEWRLAYSLEVDGSSLGTLYERCEAMSTRSQRAGYVLVVQDNANSVPNGSVFGAYLTDTPKPSQHYYGTGECFLWRASILPSLRSLQLNNTNNNTTFDGTTTMPMQDLLELAGLPPPPSADTTNATRTTTLRGEPRSPRGSTASSPNAISDLSKLPFDSLSISGNGTGSSTPDRIRFKAFPYSGMNDFMIFCQSAFLSVGGGDGHYGLWLDDSLDNGVSESCPTFGNEPLSEEGKKFEVLGVEVWYVGA